MQTREVGSRAAATSEDGPAGPFTELAVGQAAPRIRELLGVAQEAARGMVEAEDALRLVREQFQRTEDPDVQGELAAEALDHVERQLNLTRERRQGLDSIEGTLWARRNRLERFLIHTRGRVWWHARRDRMRPAAPASDRT
jgi:hypothetical protein